MMGFDHVELAMAVSARYHWQSQLYQGNVTTGSHLHTRKWYRNMRPPWRRGRRVRGQGRLQLRRGQDVALDRGKEVESQAYAHTWKYPVSVQFLHRENQSLGYADLFIKRVRNFCWSRNNIYMKEAFLGSGVYKNLANKCS